MMHQGEGSVTGVGWEKNGETADLLKTRSWTAVWGSVYSSCASATESSSSTAAKMWTLG